MMKYFSQYVRYVSHSMQLDSDRVPLTCMAFSLQMARLEKDFRLVVSRLPTKW
jgi:hypothetical protein